MTGLVQQLHFVKWLLKVDKMKEHSLPRNSFVLYGSDDKKYLHVYCKYTSGYIHILVRQSKNGYQFSTFTNLKFINKRWLTTYCSCLWVVDMITNLNWIHFRSFHRQSASHLPLVYWRHYSYKWTFVLKECRVCRRVGGWEGDSSSAVCKGLLFHPD